MSESDFDVRVAVEEGESRNSTRAWSSTTKFE
jgi:hypothetical protein